MLGFQTLSCLHEIPVVRSSTDKLQDVYAQAKNTSVLIRLPCNVAETIFDKSLKFALTVVNPFITSLSGPVRVIDDYAAQKIRQIESKYPVINTRTEDVVNTFNEKTEPVRNVFNTVKDTTTSTIQHGKDTVSNVATATVNKASGVAGSVFSFYESHVPGNQRQNSGKLTGLNSCVFSTVGSVLNYAFQSAQLSLLWFRMLTVFFLLKIKQINDFLLNKFQQKPKLTALPQHLLIFVGTLLEKFIQRIRPNDRTLAELKKSRQQSRSNQQTPYFFNRSNIKSDPLIRTRQNVSATKQQTIVNHTVSHTQPDDTEQLYADLATDDLQESIYNVDNDGYRIESNDDISQLHAQLNTTDIEQLYSRVRDTDENEDQQ